MQVHVGYREHVGDQDLDEEEFVAMTPGEAQKFRQENPGLSPWSVVVGQSVVGVMLAGLAWLLTQQREIAVSVACGALATTLPAAVFARGLMGRFASLSIASAVTSFFLWELVKIVMTVTIMLTAHRWVSDLNWPAMLVGLVVTMKVYWLASLFRGKRQPVVSN
jgi:ATP synthase protein I